MPQKLINQRFNIQDKEANYQHCEKLCQFMPILITITCVKIKKKVIDIMSEFCSG